MEGRQHLDHHFYHTSEFAEMASVSVRTLYTNMAKMPAGERPYPMPYNQEEGAFLQEMIEAYRGSQR